MTKAMRAELRLRSRAYLVTTIILSLGNYWVQIEGASHSHSHFHSVSKSKSKSKSKSRMDCYFIFGDSQSDNGNNNDIKGDAMANYKPYGIDFPNQNSPTPTGRFTNGRNLPDFIAELLGFHDYIPPFRNTTGWNVLKGVNYASGGSGIHSETGRMLGKVLSINKQLENHNHTISRIQGSLGSKLAATKHLKSCLYTVQAGSNDYLNNYFLPFSYKTSAQFTPQQYAVALNKQLSHQLEELYDRGGRKVAVFGVGGIGCTPYARANFEHEGSPCVEKINYAIQLFNSGLKSLIHDLNTKFTDAKFIFIDVFKISTMKPTPLVPADLLVLDAPCCEVPVGQLQCTPFGKVCGNRSKYMFWDGVHPTELGFKLVAKRAFNAKEPDDTYPFDISHLVRL
ncbi:GDSL esterase/lipase At1g29670-like [Momordica charantia]|uniref:GDSL esterase/lipase At1g29670-like n=1 Tax=Momordica charantia TaxID=3673 RepID=A0A6J1CSH4_MOMCH|nr:GDSL esterase/lipase At1g29670-like [Momordica charantia]